jgi:hypothetical protein
VRSVTSFARSENIQRSATKTIYLVIDVCHAQFGFDDHTDDTEHGEYQRVIGYTLSSLVQRLPTAELVSAAAAGTGAARGPRHPPPVRVPRPAAETATAIATRAADDNDGRGRGGLQRIGVLLVVVVVVIVVGVFRTSMLLTALMPRRPLLTAVEAAGGLERHQERLTCEPRDGNV